MAIKRITAKVMALRTAVAELNTAKSIDWDGICNDSESIDMINEEIEKIKETLRKRAVKLGGEFNQFNGL